MSPYQKPSHWADPKKKLFPHQVGFAAPPHDFCAAPTDFMSIAPKTVGVHGRLMHIAEYAHELKQRADNFHLLEEFVHCMANAGADAVGQVGTNWVHAGGTDAADIRALCARLSETYDTAFHMAGLCLVEALETLNISRIALNSVYFWPDWRDGVVRFLKSADLDLRYAGNFVDLGFYNTQQEVNDQIWIFPGDLALESVVRTAERAPDAEAIVINGMPNWRGPDGQPERTLHRVEELEASVGIPIVSADFALYWRIFKSLGIAPSAAPGRLLSTLA